MSTVGPRLGLGPIAYQVAKIEKCDERVVDACETGHRCCAVISCEYCLEWEIYGQPIQYGTAAVSDTGALSGLVAGITLLGEWQRNVYTNECEFVVTVNDEIVTIIPYCGYITCRNYSWEVEVTVNDQQGTLRWIRREKRPLPYRQNDKQCVKHFCGSCECTCRCLCVTLIEANGDEYRATFCDTAYSDCSGPVWAGEINYKSISIALQLDPYTEGCAAAVTADGVEYEPELIDDCSTVAGSITLEDYSTLSWTCEECNCDQIDNISTPTCPCDPMPRSILYSWTLTNPNTNETCESGSGTLEFAAGNLIPTWIGTWKECEIKLECVANAGIGNPCDNSNSEFTYQVTICGTTTTTPQNQPYNDLNGTCFCPLYVRVCFAGQNGCGPPGNAILCFEFTE